MARPEDFGAQSGASEQDQMSHGANARFHDLVYRQPSGNGGRDPEICHAWDLNRTHGGGGGGSFGGLHGNSADAALGKLYVDLAREGKLDKNTVQALEMLQKEVEGNRWGEKDAKGEHGGWKHGGHKGHGRRHLDEQDQQDDDQAVLASNEQPMYGPGSVAEQNIPRDANGNPIAYTAMDTGALSNGATGATSADGTLLPNASNPAGTTGGDASLAGAGAMSPQDAQTMAAVWASVNGADVTDANQFQKVTAGPDGKTIGVGPYALSADVVGQWLGQAADQNGNIDANALSQLAQSKGLSQDTIAAITSPDFQQFMQQLASGQSPPADQVAKFMPPELQNAIAGDMVNSMATALTQSGQQPDAGVLIASLEAGKPLTQQDLQDTQIAAMVQSIDSQLSGGATGPTGTDTTGGTGGTGATGADVTGATGTTGFGTTGDGTGFGANTTGGIPTDGTTGNGGVTISGGDNTGGSTVYGSGTQMPFTIPGLDTSGATGTTGTTGGDGSDQGNTGPLTQGGAAPIPSNGG